jgi:hypothetical protein
LARIGHAQCTTVLSAVQPCTVPGAATTITDAGGGNANVSIAGGTYVYRGTSGISNLNMAGGTLYYASNGTLNSANITGGLLIYSGTGVANNINQSGGTVQVCDGGALRLTGNLNAGACVVAAGGSLTFPNPYTLKNSALFTNYGTVSFQSSLSIASGSLGTFVNAGTLTASGHVFLNGPGFVNQGTATFGTLAVNGSGRACLSPRSVLNVTTFQTNDNANSMTVSPTAGAPACIRISSYGNFNSLLATAVPSKVSICRVGTASAAELAKHGTAQVTQNCSNCQTVLPVVLLAFTAVTDGPQAVRLTWATASEHNSAYFEV